MQRGGKPWPRAPLLFVIATLGLGFMKARWRDGALPEDDLTGSASAVTGPLQWVLTGLDVLAAGPSCE